MLDYSISIRYMITGYSAILVVLFIYIASLYVRWRNLRRDLNSLEETGKKG
jgi:hypothetical protein